MRPRCITRIMSARLSVLSRWAITNVVRPRIALSIAVRISSSVLESIAAVGSSSNRMGGSSSMARAIATRWR